jgi:hypothetical protein
MKIKTFLAISVIAALLMSLTPAPQVLADGAASTRNILLGVGAAAATLIIINHNKKVHQKYAEDAQAQAALASQRNDAQAAYRAEVKAYDNQVAVNTELKEEVAIKDKQVQQQNDAIGQLRQQLAQMGVQTQQVAAVPAPAPKHALVSAHAPQMISYGWGTL